MTSQAALPEQQRLGAGRLQRFWQSTIGKKIVMGVTGLIMVAFVIAHMIGNLQVFVGAEKINAYGNFLHHTIAELLWVVRVVLLVSVVLHVTAAWQLTRIDRAARTVAYARKVSHASTLASRTIRWGGVILLLFIIFHILHFTTGTIQPVPFVPSDVYSNVVRGFRLWWLTAIYVIAMIALGLHLYHGTWSAFRTLGLNQPNRDPLRRRGVAVLAALVWLGFTAVPIAVFFGLLR